MLNTNSCLAYKRRDYSRLFLLPKIKKKEYLDEWVESYARVNLRPATYDGYKRTIHNYTVPYIGHVALNQLSLSMIDKVFQEMLVYGK